LEKKEKIYWNKILSRLKPSNALTNHLKNYDTLCLQVLRPVKIEGKAKTFIKER